MTKQEFDDLYLGKVVHCDTEEKANEFLKLAHWFGYKWFSGRSLLDRNYYFEYQEETCYLVGGFGFEYCAKSFYMEEGYEIVEFKQEKENNMKYKVGDKVRVRKDLVVYKKYGSDTFVSDMISFKGKQVTIKKVNDEKYQIEEDDSMWNWTDEMLEPVEEFNVGDVVYTAEGFKGTIVDTAWVVKFENKEGEFFRTYEELTHQKPLKEITEKELADMGFVLKK